jgi:hypothetical protein
MAHYARELVPCSAFYIEHLIALEPDKARMCQIERYRESWNALRGEPLLRKPDMRAKAETPAFECFIKGIDAGLEPCPFYSKAEVLDPQPKKSLVGPGGP